METLVYGIALGVCIAIIAVLKISDHRREQKLQQALEKNRQHTHRLMQQCYDLDRAFWEAKQNISHDCTVIDRDQQN